MPVVRFTPGEPAPRAGVYDLVLEWGERTGIEAHMQRGEPFPTASVPADDDLWWVEREPTRRPAPQQRSHGAPRRPPPPRPRTAVASPVRT